MKLVVVLYILLMTLVFKAVGDIRSGEHKVWGPVQAILIALGCALITVVLFAQDWLGPAGKIVHLAAMAAASVLGFLLDRARHRRWTIEKANEYGGRTYIDELRLPKGKRIRNTYHLDSQKGWAQVDRWEYHEKQYRIEEKTYYTEPGFCRCEWFDPEGALVVKEEKEILKYRTFNREYPSGKEAAAFLLDRWARSPLASLGSVEELEPKA